MTAGVGGGQSGCHRPSPGSSGGRPIQVSPFLCDAMVPCLVYPSNWSVSGNMVGSTGFLHFWGGVVG